MTSDSTRGERVLRVFLVLLGGLLVANNLLPYVGLRDDSCQTMFSSLEWGEGDNNHLFMPQHALSDVWAYRVDVEVSLDPPPEQDGHDDMLLRWLEQPHRALNTEAVRVVLDQLCQRRRVSMRWRMRGDAQVHWSPDACADDELSAPTGVPFRLYETDFSVADHSTESDVEDADP
ncbi:MAG: hypothetical protein AB8H86_14335 [Polyangiales bacterium]